MHSFMNTQTFLQSFSKSMGQINCAVRFPSGGWFACQATVPYALGDILVTFETQVLGRLKRMESGDNETQRQVALDLFKAFQVRASGKEPQTASLLKRFDARMHEIYGSHRNMQASAHDALRLLGQDNTMLAQRHVHFDYVCVSTLQPVGAAIQ